MKTITVAQLRQNPTSALDDVENGETYEVTRHRRVIARLVPPEPEPVQLIPARRRGPVRFEDLHLAREYSYEATEARLEEMKGDW